MLTPLYDLVLVKEATPEEMSKGGLIIPESARKHGRDMRQGVVVAVGPGRMVKNGEGRVPIEANEGDRVVLKEYSGVKVELVDEEHFLVKDEDILAVATEG